MMPINISIFAKPPYYLRGYLHRVSSMIRGEQISIQIGARLNPEKDYQNDICVYVKPSVSKSLDYFDFAKNAYLDIVDDFKLIHLMVHYPQIPIIACSKSDYDVISTRIANRVIFIPQHHCNFERAIRQREGISVLGIIGAEYAFNYLPSGLEQELNRRNISLFKFSKFSTREDVINFYKQIDVQIVWRPYKVILTNPLKIVNAASFGIPTIACNEKSLSEVSDFCLVAHNLNDLLINLDALISSRSFYSDYSQKCIEVSEAYHIECIGKEYLQCLT